MYTKKMSILVVLCANMYALVVIGNICLTAGSITFPGLINHQRTQSLPLENPAPLTTDHSTPQPPRNVKTINPQKCMYRTLPHSGFLCSSLFCSRLPAAFQTIIACYF